MYVCSKCFSSRGTSGGFHSHESRGRGLLLTLVLNCNLLPLLPSDPPPIHV